MLVQAQATLGSNARDGSGVKRTAVKISNDEKSTIASISYYVPRGIYKDCLSYSYETNFIHALTYIPRMAGTSFYSGLTNEENKKILELELEKAIGTATFLGATKLY